MSKHEFKIYCSTEWNTGRMYRSDGQPIKAYIVEIDGELLVFFRDRARMIDGLIEVVTFVSPMQLQRHVMDHYDRDLYEGWRAGGEHGISTFEVARLIKETTGEHA
jgi:hypothetical protein